MLARFIIHLRQGYDWTSVMNRGDRREPSFNDDKDRQGFLTALAEACGKTGWQIHAFCLLSNHFHLVVETPQPNLVAGMKWLLGTYTGRFNRRHREFGHLFSGRYKALQQTNGGASLRGRASADGNGTGGRDCAGELEAAGMERGRFGGAGEGGPGEIETGGSAADGNVRDHQMDRPTAVHGNLDTPQPFAILASP